MFVVFVATLARPALVEAEPIALALGSAPYETRLALAAGPPSILLTTTDRKRAADALAALRGRGHDAHVFDEENFVASANMTKLDDFAFEPDGVRRNTASGSGELLGFGDIYAIVRAVHETSTDIEGRPDFNQRLPSTRSLRIRTRVQEREQVAYFFRRSGDRPWLLRERHASYVGLSADRNPSAFANFTRLLGRMRESSTMAIFDDRLVRRRVAERAGTEGHRSTGEIIDLLAHLLAMTIASQGGSPYR